MASAQTNGHFNAWAASWLGVFYLGSYTNCFRLPAYAHSYLGIYSGLLLGLCAAYHWKTLLNCFGALLMATNIFGVKSAIILRIMNNIIGCCFGVLFYYVYNFTVDRFANARTGRS